MFLFKEQLYFLVDFLLDRCDEVVKIVKILLGEFPFMEVDIVNKVLSGLRKDFIELVESFVHLCYGVHLLLTKISIGYFKKKKVFSILIKKENTNNLKMQKLMIKKWVEKVSTEYDMMTGRRFIENEAVNKSYVAVTSL